jgi:Leucine-rich repeat (LRR) protein
MDKWMPFDDDTDFSESNHESISSEVEYLAHTSLLELTPRSMELDASRSGVSQGSTPNPQRHPSLGRMVVMDSGMSHSPPSSSHRRKSKKSSSKRPGVRRSGSSSRSMNPTPSVIAAGVQQVAAKLDVDMSPTRSNKNELTVSPLLNDDNSEEQLKKAPTRSESRQLRIRHRRRTSGKPEDIELITDGDHESMSTVSYDLSLDLVSSFKANIRRGDDHGDSEEVMKVSPIPSDRDRQRAVSEALEMKRASQISEKQKAVSSNSLADVLEGSREGELTEDESPGFRTKQTRKPNTTPPPSPVNETISFKTDPTDFYRKKDVAAARFESVEVRYQQMESETTASGRVADGIPADSKGASEDGPRSRPCSCSKLLRNPFFLGFGCAVLLGLIVVVVVFLVTRANAGGGRPPSAFSDDELLNLIANQTSVDSTLLLMPESLQGQAFLWLKGADVSVRSDQKRILQRFALVTLFFYTKGENWYASEGWLSDTSECTWFSSGGSPCDEYGNVTSLSLSSNKLVGELPAEIALLTSLHSIDLSGNNLFGALPPTFEDLVRLSSLNLDSNAFDRRFPELLTRLTNLRVLSLSMNQITGLLPSSISKLTNVEVFSVAANRLVSSMPSDISKMTALRELYLEFNELSGPIASELGLLSHLENIKLDLNLFSSGVPSELGLLVNLNSFSCNDCSLVGALPTEIGRLHRLNTFEVQSNQLTGSIPSEIGSASSLRMIDLSTNSFVGSLPSDVGRLTSISLFDASGNNLTGTIPRELAYIDSRGFVFYLDNNQLTGTVPAEVCTKLVGSEDVISLKGTKVALCNCVKCHNMSLRG